MKITKKEIEAYMEKMGKFNIEFFKDEMGESVSYEKEVFGRVVKDISFTKAIVLEMIKKHYGVDDLGKVKLQNIDRTLEETIIHSIISEKEMKQETFSAFTQGSGRVLFNEDEVILVLFV